MTTRPREWPNNQRRYRNRAAEESAIAMRKARLLLARVKQGKFTRAGLERDLLYIIDHAQTAVRHLEKAGAETEPE